ncbi:MAG: SCO family protein [Planctomycetes bacterium]|nr:SCO family protein [Planctomycetota bacterium]
MRPPSLIVILASSIGILLGACQHSPEGLQDFPAVNSFNLHNAHGEFFTEADLDGEVWIVNFFFTRCPTICPPLMDAVEKVYSRWEDEARVRFLSITVDGDYDEPEILAEYRASRNLPSEKWTLATAPRDTIRALSEQSFLQAVSTEMDESGDILHSSRVLVLDPQRALRGWFDVFEEDEHSKLDAVIDYLLTEKR